MQTQASTATNRRLTTRWRAVKKTRAMASATNHSTGHDSESPALSSVEDRRRTRFQAQAKKRINRAIVAIQKIGQLGSRDHFMGVSDLARLRSTLQSQIDDAIQRFRKPGTDKDTFTFTS